MSEQAPSKDVSLADLKRAIAVCVNHQLADYEYMELKAEAWRAAFEWRDSVDEHSAEIHEGMRLIRETLK